MSRTAARAAAAALAERVAKGEDPRRPTQARGVRTFGDAVNDFLDTHVKNLREASQQNYHAIFNRPAIMAWNEKPLHSITRKDVLGLTDQIRAEHAPMADKIEATLRVLWDWNAEYGHVDAAANPARAKTRLAIHSRKSRADKPRGRDRVLDDVEIGLFWAELYRSGMLATLRFLLRFLLLSGQRSNDARLMEWKHLDHGLTLWTIPAGLYKVGKSHQVPISSAMKVVLESARATYIDDGARYVFSPDPLGASPYQRTTLPDALRRARKEGTLTLSHFVVHDLRRTVRSGLDRIGGVDYVVAERIIGHTIGSAAAQRYDRHPFMKERREALERWGQHVETLATRYRFG
jgi:integrase